MSLAFQIANALLNDNMIREDITAHDLEAAIDNVLSPPVVEGVGKVVHMRDGRYPKEALCHHGTAKALSLTGDAGVVTCKRCRVSMMD